MASSYSFACTDFPGMEGCPGKFTAATKEEVRQLAEVHAKIAHDEDPSDWSKEDIAQFELLIREN